MRVRPWFIPRFRGGTGVAHVISSRTPKPLLPVLLIGCYFRNFFSVPQTFSFNKTLLNIARQLLLGNGVFFLFGSAK